MALCSIIHGLLRFWLLYCSMQLIEMHFNAFLGDAVLQGFILLRSTMNPIELKLGSVYSDHLIKLNCNDFNGFYATT